MKVSCFVITAVLCGTQALMAGSGYAQDINHVSITLELRNEPLKDAFKKIEQLSTFRFAYKDKQVKRCEAISIPPGTRSVRATLDMILNNTSLEFKQVGNNVIVYSKKEGEPDSAITELPEVPVNKPPSLFDGGIKGKVTNGRGEPLVGASVTILNTDIGTSADNNGLFTLTGIKAGRYRLQVTAVGYANIVQNVTVTDDKVVDITMTLTLNEGTNSMEDVVVIGYQNVIRRNSTAAISTVKGKDFENVPYPTFDQMLQGRVAGLNVLNISGEPGVNNIVNIRGNTSVDATGLGISAPLYVIDGIVFDVSDIRSAYGQANPLQAINPNDIESVDVLKDASAAAIYGARAANGVIIIKTKRPKKGRPEMRLSSYVGISTRPAMKAVLVGQEERRLKMALLFASGQYANQGNVSQFLTDSLNPAFNNNTDWQGMFLRDAIIQNTDFSIGAADEKFTYRISLNRYQEDGIVRGYRLTRMNPRLFISAKPFKGVEITSDIFLGITKALHGPGNQNIYPFSVSNFPSSFWNIDEQAEKNYTGRNDKVRDDDRTTSINGNTRLMLNILPSLIFTSSLSYNFGFSRRDYLQHRTVSNNNRSDAIHTAINNRRWEIENYLTWNKQLGDHTITALLGQGAEENFINRTDARANGIPFDAIQVIQGVPAGPALTAGTTFEDRSRLSLFARVGYDYKGKYGIEGSYRRDASSRYSPDSRWGAFPAISARWNISEEPFFDKYLGVINFLKVRASFGITGRDPGSYYAQYRILTTDVRYSGSSLGAGASSNVITYNGVTAVVPNYGASAPAANITWERTPQANLGIDASFFQNRIMLTADFYKKDSREVVFDIPVATTTGYTLATNNYVDVRNQGVEITLTTRNLPEKSKWQWSTTFNIAFNDNFVTKLPAGGRDFVFGPPWLQRTLTVGMPLYQFLAWDISQVYPTIDDVPIDPLTGQRIRWFGGSMFGAGDGAKTDVNGDFNIENIDKIFMGDPQTKVYGGIINSVTYKNFTLSVLCSFIQGRKLWNGYLSDKLNGSAGAPFTNWGPNSGPAADFGGLEFWQNPGDNAFFPSLFGNAVDKWHIAQSLFIEDASFFRIKNVSLGYMIPEKLAKKLKMRGIRFYSIIDNLAVFYNATVPDPELVSPDGYTNGNDYPLPKKFTFGVDINF